MSGNLHCLLALGEYDELEGSALALKSHLKSAEQIDEYASWMAEVQKLGTSSACYLLPSSSKLLSQLLHLILIYTYAE